MNVTYTLGPCSYQNFVHLCIQTYLYDRANSDDETGSYNIHASIIGLGRNLDEADEVIRSIQLIRPNCVILGQLLLLSLIAERSFDVAGELNPGGAFKTINAFCKCIHCRHTHTLRYTCGETIKFSHEKHTNTHMHTHLKICTSH